MNRKLLALAVMMCSTGFLALAPTGSADHCAPTEPICVPHQVNVCSDEICVTVQRPSNCTVDVDDLTADCA